MLLWCDSKAIAQLFLPKLAGLLISGHTSGGSPKPQQRLRVFPYARGCGYGEPCKGKRSMPKREPELYFDREPGRRGLRLTLTRHRRLG